LNAMLLSAFAVCQIKINFENPFTVNTLEAIS
jgi:hypothetical protein